MVMTVLFRGLRAVKRLGHAQPWGLLVAVTTLSAACSASDAPSAGGAVLPDYLPGWEAYEVMDDASFDLAAVEGELTPFSLAQSLMVAPETLECFRTAQVRVTAVDDDTYTVLATQVGLCDDSVAALEQRIDLTPTSTGWMLDQVGQRYGCARPEFAWAEPGTLCP